MDLLSSSFRDSQGNGGHGSAGEQRALLSGAADGRKVPVGLAEPGGRPSSCSGAHFTPLWSLPVFVQEAIGVCFAAGFDHLAVVWFLSLSSLGGFNYLN